MGTAQPTAQPLLVLVIDEGDESRNATVGTMAATLRRAVPGIRLVVTSRNRIAAALPASAKDGGPAPAEAAATVPAPGLEEERVILSPREREVLPLLTAGLTNREIGAELHLSADAIKKHVSAILRKLGARNRTEAARLAAALTPPSASPVPPRAAA